MQPGSRVRVLEPLVFDFPANVWRAGIRRERAIVNRLTLVTVNLWFGETQRDWRLRAFLDLVEGCSPDVIGLQEVTPSVLSLLLSADWVRRSYQVSDATGHTLEPHGVLLLSRLPVSGLSLCHLPSRKGRKMVVGLLKTGEGSICVGTVHLESSPLNLPTRLEQLDRILPSLRGTKNAVLMGDFNFDPRDQAEQSRLKMGYTDLWPALHGADPGYTVDSARNRMRLLHKQTSKQARFDRILLRSVDRQWVPEGIRMIGTRPISQDLFVSDHFGLVGTIVRSRKAITG